MIFIAVLVFFSLMVLLTAAVVMRHSWKVRGAPLPVFWTGAVLGAVSLLAISILGGATIPLSVFVMLTYVMILVSVVQRSRIVWVRVLGAGHARNVPLEELLESILHSVSPFDRDGLNRAGQALSSGASLPAALRHLPLPGGIVPLLSAELLGGKSASDTIQRDTWRREQALLRARAQRGGRWLYLALLVTTITIVFCLVKFLITPAIVWLAHDIGGPAELNTTLGRLIHLSDQPGFGIIMILLFLLAQGCGILGALQYTSIAPYMSWRTPKTIWGMRLLPGLAATLRARKPLTELPLQLEQTAVPKPLRQALQVVAAAEKRGESWIEALVKARYLDPRYGSVLETASQLGNFPWAAEAVADRICANILTRQQRVDFVLFPLLLVAVGAIVAVIPISIIAIISYAALHV